jgi:beta-lactamase regulating signal transducer with metallopeptidase domain/protocatechuate 3,4-dioxygenase beta subunit
MKWTGLRSDACRVTVGRIGFLVKTADRNDILNAGVFSRNHQMNQLLSLLDSIIVERIGWTLVHSVWQIAIVAVVVIAVTLVSARQCASVRYLVLCAGMLACIAIPIGTFAAYRSEFEPTESLNESRGKPMSPRESASESLIQRESSASLDSALTPADIPTIQLATVATTRTSDEQTFATFGTGDAHATNPGQAVQPPGELPMFARGSRALNAWLPTIFGLWIVGVIILATRPLIGIFFSRRMRHHGRSSVPDNVSRLMAEACRQLRLHDAIEIAQSTLVEIPGVIGYFKPLILLPASAITGLNETQLRAILLHELAHIRRHDYLFNLLQTVVESLLFYHPLVWWLSSRIRIERENCCDDIVLEHCDDRSEYVRALVQLESGHGHFSVVAIHATGGSLVKRVRRIAGKENSRAANAWVAGVIVLALISLIPISQSSTWAIDPEQQAEKFKPGDESTVGSGKIKVLVVDDAEEPVANARVERRIGDTKIAVQTDKTGVAELELPNEPPALLSIHVSGDFVPCKVQWDNSNKRDPNPIPATFTFHVSKGRTLSGRITDAAGNPVVGAKLTPADYDWVAMRNGKEEPDWTDWEFQTDRDGYWSFDHAPLKFTRFDAIVSHADFANDHIRFNTLTVKTHLLTMQSGVTVRGTITDPTGTPVANTQVMLTPKFGAPGSWMTRSNDQGEYEFERVKPDEFGLTVMHKDYAPQTEVMKGFHGDQSRDFQLRPGTPMSFHFVNENGKPVEGVRVTCGHWMNGQELDKFEDVTPGVSDANGDWIWKNAPQGHMTYAVEKLNCLNPGGLWLEPKDEPYEYVIHSLLEISGTVTSKSTGKPIPEFKVIRGHWSSGNGFSYRANSDETKGIAWDLYNSRSMTNGQYRFRIDETQDQHYIKIEASGYKPAVSRAFHDSDGKLSLDFQLEEGSDVTGTIVDQDGSSVRNAKVLYVLPGRQTDLRNLVPEEYGLISALSDVDGKFLLPEQDQKFAIMVIADEGFAFVLEDQFVKAKQQIRIDAWATVRGTCMIGDKPAAGHEMALFYARFEDVPENLHMSIMYQNILVKNDGSYEISRVPPNMTCTIGRYIFTERRYGGASGSQSHAHRITTQPGVVAEVNVGGTGRPLIGKFQLPAEADRSVDDWNGSHAILRRVSDLEDGVETNLRTYPFSVNDDGTFRVDDLPAGDYQLSYSVVDWLANNEHFEVARVEEQFTIPEIDGGRSDEVFDLGTMILELKK